MATLFPAVIDAFRKNRIQGEQTPPGEINDIADAVNQLENELGISEKGSYKSAQARLNAAAMIGAGRQVRNAFDPTKMNVVARWQAEAIPGTDGTVVSAWVDSINGITPVQAVAANQPHLKLGANGINGKSVVRFSSAGPQYLSLAAPPAVIPVNGQVTVITVHRPITSAGRMRFLTNSAVAIGWGTGMNGGSSLMTIYGNADYTPPNNGMVATNGLATIQVQEILPGNQVLLGANNWYPDYTVATAAPNAGATTLNIGAGHGGGDPLNGDIAEILVFNRPLTSAERHQIIKYLGAYYGIRTGSQYNAAVKDTIPTTTGAGVCTEPSFLYFPNGWNGYKYWLSFVRYDGGIGNNEEPGIVVSNTGNGADWIVPPGGSNPITPQPASGHTADPRLRMSPDGLTMYLFYARQVTPTDGVAMKSTVDGITWSAETLILAAPGGDGSITAEPAPVWDGKKWNLYTWNDLNTALYMERRTCATLTGAWSAPERVNFMKPLGNQDQTGWWHGDVFYLNGVFYMVCIDGGGNPQVTARLFWVGCSTDGINFDVMPTPLMAGSDRSVVNWDAGLYRPCFQLSADGKDLLVWYAAFNNLLNSGQHFIGHTTIPIGELP